MRFITRYHHLDVLIRSRHGYEKEPRNFVCLMSGKLRKPMKLVVMVSSEDSPGQTDIREVNLTARGVRHLTLHNRKHNSH